MGIVLNLKTRDPERPHRAASAAQFPCEVVIFPGVRIERHELDLGHRLRDSAGHDDFDGIGGGQPRKTS